MAEKTEKEMIWRIRAVDEATAVMQKASAAAAAEAKKAEALQKAAVAQRAAARKDDLAFADFLKKERADSNTQLKQGLEDSKKGLAILGVAGAAVVGILKEVATSEDAAAKSTNQFVDSMLASVGRQQQAYASLAETIKQANREIAILLAGEGGARLSASNALTDSIEAIKKDAEKKVADLRASQGRESTQRQTEARTDGSNNIIEAFAPSISRAIGYRWGKTDDEKIELAAQRDRMAARQADAEESAIRQAADAEVRKKEALDTLARAREGIRAVLGKIAPGGSGGRASSVLAEMISGAVGQANAGIASVDAIQRKQAADQVAQIMRNVNGVIPRLFGADGGFDKPKPATGSAVSGTAPGVESGGTGIGAMLAERARGAQMRELKEQTKAIKEMRDAFKAIGMAGPN